MFVDVPRPCARFAVITVLVEHNGGVQYASTKLDRQILEAAMATGNQVMEKAAALALYETARTAIGLAKEQMPAARDMGEARGKRGED